MSGEIVRKKARLDGGGQISQNFVKSARPVRPAAGEIFNQGFGQFLGELVQTGLEMPLCFCRTPHTVTSNAENHSKLCQALDTTGSCDIPCNNLVTNSVLVRPHVRVSFLALCQYHLFRLRSHSCCPICGIFCSKGKFNVCRESEKFPHLFHVGCGENYFFNACPHCGSKNVVQKEVDLIGDGFQVKFNAKMGLSLNKPTNFYPVNDNTLLSDYDNQEPNLNNIIEPDVRQRLRDVLDQAKQNISNAVVVTNQDFIDSIANNDLLTLWTCMCKSIDPDLNVPSNDHGDTLNQTALHVAAKENFVEMAFLLIQAGANVDACDSENCTPLMNAVNKNSLGIVKLLIMAKARVDLKDSSGNTALHFAAVQGHCVIVKLLADSCYAFNRQVSKERLNSADADLTENTCLINAQDNGGWTPLMWAAENGRGEAILNLLHYGAQTSIVDNERNIALHWAVMSGNDSVVTPLVDACKPEELDAQNMFGDTPLIIACQRQFRKMIEYLLHKNANFSISNNQGCSALDVCRELQDSTSELLMEAKKMLPPPNNDCVIRPRVGRVICPDISKGYEQWPIPVVNDVDNESTPEDFIYCPKIIENDRSIRRAIFDLHGCKCTGRECKENCCSCRQDFSAKNPLWYDKDGLLGDEYDFGQSQPEIFECTPLCACSANCYNRVAQKGIQVRLQVKKTIGGKGWGLFAVEDIPYGKFVCEYTGEIIPDEIAEQRLDDSYLFDLNVGNSGLSIDAKRYGNAARFINHSCEPNVAPVRVYWDHYDARYPHICFFAYRAIKIGEEICFDYGTAFWSIKGESMECACESTSCKYKSEKMRQFLDALSRRVRHEITVG